METQHTTPTFRQLYCACCGASTRGIQCKDRDTGYGFCASCIARYASIGCALDRCDCFYPRLCRCDRDGWQGEGHSPRCRYNGVDRTGWAQFVAMLEVN